MKKNRDENDDIPSTDSDSPSRNVPSKVMKGDSSHVENTGKVFNGVGKITNILSKLHSLFENGKRPIKQISSSSHSVTNEKYIKQKPDKVFEHVNVEDGLFSKAHTSNDESKDSSSGLSYLLPNNIANMLYPHQVEGVEWLWSLHCEGKGGVLSDDMGLGKTMQICAFLAGLFRANLIKRVLVVAPKTVLPHWMKELGVVNLSGKTRAYVGTCAKTRQHELHQFILQDNGVLLTTYDIVRHNVKSLCGDNVETGEEALTWDYIILDEGHLIKNPSTQRAKRLRAIPCSHRIIIRGTPLQNNLKELWALFDFCCPGLLGNKKWFKSNYEKDILRGREKNATERKKLIGSAVAQKLGNHIQPYFLRRLKAEVFGEDGAKLSRKNEIVVWLRLSPCQQQLYEAFLTSEKDGYYSPLPALTILKKICDHPLLLTKRAAKNVLHGMESMLSQEDQWVAENIAKHIADVADECGIKENNDNVSCKISFVMSLLDNLIPEGHNVLIFSQTRIMLNLLQDTLNARGYKFLRMDGTTKPSDRLKIVNDFQEGGKAPIFLLTSKVGGLGLTLTKADRVIVIDPAWNPSTDNQSVDRAYRIGQNKDVIVYRLITCSTIEEKIYRNQIYKVGLFKCATEREDQLRYFSQKDLKDLFSLPEQGFDVSLTCQQLHKEHDYEHKMDSSLEHHTNFLESLCMVGISHHRLLFSKVVPMPVFRDEKRTRVRQAKYMSNSSSRYSHEQTFNIGRFAFNRKDVGQRKNLSPNVSDKLTESETKQVNRVSQVYANKGNQEVQDVHALNEEDPSNQQEQSQEKANREARFETLFRNLNIGNNVAFSSQQTTEEAPEFHDATADLIIDESDLNDTNIDSNISTGHVFVFNPYQKLFSDIPFSLLQRTDLSIVVEK
ncbi:protein CHROMATIN REMODELING 24-like [Bidens hawaiensis]|uniref:protein CHROMATIN REMODELING 24-like n=1 Tax=Bidens hawaiensis TaxID=980011 RepID=UPI00404B34D9